jgi:site-specific DNA-cytosine methylase
MEQIRVIKEMREHDRQLGHVGADVAPRFNIWENVPGALSSTGGKDFQAVLTELARVADERIPDVPFPKSGKWGNSGALFGVGADGCPFSIAWRIHDAQFWGVPQRRRRICVLADWGGSSAARILLGAQYHGEAEDPETHEAVADTGDQPRSEVPAVPEGVSGNPESRGAERQGTAESTEGRADGTSYTLKIRGGIERDRNGRKAGKGALIQTEKSATLGVSQDQTLIQTGTSSAVSVSAKQYFEAETEVASSLFATDYKEPQAVAYTAEEPSPQRLRATTKIGSRTTPPSCWRRKNDYLYRETLL